MKKFSINQDRSEITVAEKIPPPMAKFDDFYKNFTKEWCLIFGRDGTGRYSLLDPVRAFEEEFWLYFRFEN